MPSSAIRSPDLAYLTRGRWEPLSPSDQQSFPPISPDFVVEIRSKTDILSELQFKMNEWIENGSHLAWLLDLDNLHFYIYRPGQEFEVKTGLDTVLSGESILPNFYFSISEFLEVL